MAKLRLPAEADCLRFPAIAIAHIAASSTVTGTEVAYPSRGLERLFFVLRGTEIQVNWLWISLSPILIFMMAGLGLGFGITISSLTTKYRDLRFLVTFGVQLLMYAAPVIYPVSSIPERYQWIILANPMTSIIEAFRYAFLGAGTVNINQLLYSFSFMIVIVLIGGMIFNRVEQTFMDTV